MPIALKREATRAYLACKHIEYEWLSNELGCDLDTIQDALCPIMYPEEFATIHENYLYTALVAMLGGISDGEREYCAAECKQARRAVERFERARASRKRVRAEMEEYQSARNEGKGATL